MKKKDFFTSGIERTSYGGYFVGQNILYIFVLQFLMLFYTDVVGISAAAVGTLFFVARLWDAINDPIMGMIVDKMSLKKGKFKPWINMVVFALPLATVLLFVDVDGSLTFKLVYAYTTYILWGMIYTVSDVPIFALATVMSVNVDERVRLISIGRLAAAIAAMITSVAAMPFITKLGWTNTALILSFIAMVTMFPIKYYAIERVVHNRKEVITFKQLFYYVFHNKYLMIFYGAVIVASLTNTGFVVGNYFAIYVLGGAKYIPMLMTMTALPMLLLSLFFPVLIKAFGKKKLLLCCVALYLVTTISYYFIGYENIILVCLFTFIKGLGLMAPFVLCAMFTSDCVEYGYYKTGQRAEGISFSIQTFTTKLTMAISGSIGAFMLQFIGYQPNVEQSAETLDGIWKMTALYPMIGYCAFFFIIFFFYNLKESDLQRMVENSKEVSE